MRKSCIAALCGIALASSCAEGRRPRLVSAGTVALAGCLSATPSAQRYRLTLIRIYSAPAETAETVAVEDGLTEWSAVEVTGGTELLRDYLGSRIKVEGTIVDSGRNTIGVPGTWGVETWSGDRSQAASDLSHGRKKALEMGRIARTSLANGGPAEIRVTHVEPTGERCSA